MHHCPWGQSACDTHATHAPLAQPFGQGRLMLGYVQTPFMQVPDGENV
jgi:hypothetical protein